MDDKDKNKMQEQQVNLNLDTTSILYTDSILMNINEDGVVLDVAQRIASTNQARIVARIGMSKEHAKKLVNKLGELLIKSEGKIETGSGLAN